MDKLPIDRLLVIRRDNIGDLVCTTPLLHQLRQHYPEAQIDILVNSYNYPVIEFNPDISNFYVYTKGKHRGADNIVKTYWERFKLLWHLRKQSYDMILLAGNYSKHATRLARQIKAKYIAGYNDPKNPDPHITKVIAIDQEAKHEVEKTNQLLTALNITPQLTDLVLKPNSKLLSKYTKKLRTQIDFSTEKPLIGLHISARKVDQRWPAENFIELVKELSKNSHYQFLLLWSPGDETNKHHPGDDQKALYILNNLADYAVYPYATQQLDTLIAIMSLCDAVVCSDGGAMHVAAGLGKPIVCFFGSSNAAQWHPWRVPFVVLQPPTLQTKDTSVAEVIQTLSAVLQVSID